MDQFAIFYLSTFFYVSHHPVQANLKDKFKIKEATVINIRERGSAQVFNSEEVILYRSVNRNRGGLKYYCIGDNLGRFSPKFAIAQFNTLVTKENITVKYGDFRIVIIPDEGQITFGIYTVISPFESFSHKVPVKNVSQDGDDLNIRNGISLVKATRVEGNEWLIVVFTRNSPCIVIPKIFVRSFSKNDDLQQVLLTIDTKPRMTVTMEFDNALYTDEFFELMMSM